jgi:hypothetical protein
MGQICRPGYFEKYTLGEKTMGNSSTGKKGSKKIGRSLKSPAHARYTGADRRRINKIRRLKKHLKKCSLKQYNPKYTGKEDKTATVALKRL